MGVTKVTLRKRLLPSGKITLYLDFYPPLRDPHSRKYHASTSGTNTWAYTS